MKNPYYKTRQHIILYLFLANNFSGLITLKAPNFDRVFMKNIFLFHIFVLEHAVFADGAYDLQHPGHRFPVGGAGGLHPPLHIRTRLRYLLCRRVPGKCTVVIGTGGEGGGLAMPTYCYVPTSPR
jgi:hypothetical protein